VHGDRVQALGASHYSTCLDKAPRLKIVAQWNPLDPTQPFGICCFHIIFGSLFLRWVCIFSDRHYNYTKNVEGTVTKPPLRVFCKFRLPRHMLVMLVSTHTGIQCVASWYAWVVIFDAYEFWTRCLWNQQVFRVIIDIWSLWQEWAETHTMDIWGSQSGCDNHTMLYRLQ
jgi:hypothetical protein